MKELFEKAKEYMKLKTTIEFYLRKIIINGKEEKDAQLQGFWRKGGRSLDYLALFDSKGQES
jgi:hypothetical protein